MPRRSEAPPTVEQLRESIRKVFYEYYFWDAKIRAGKLLHGDSERLRFESWLEGAAEDAGLDNRAIYEEAVRDALA